MQHLNTQNVITGEGYNFWAVNLRGAKIFWALAFQIITALPPNS